MYAVCATSAQRNGSFHQMKRATQPMTVVPMACVEADDTAELLRPLDALPFVPSEQQGEENLAEIVNIQCTGLMTRMAGPSAAGIL